MRAVVSSPVFLCHLAQHAAVPYGAAAERTPWEGGGGEPWLCWSGSISSGACAAPHTQDSQLCTWAHSRPSQAPSATWEVGDRCTQKHNTFRQRKEQTPASHISVTTELLKGKTDAGPARFGRKGWGLVLLEYQPAGKDVGSGHCASAVQRKTCT